MAKLLDIDAIYPVGSVYLTIDSGFDPNVKFGGVWSLIQSGRSLQTTNTGGGQLIEAGLPEISGAHLYSFGVKDTPYVGTGCFKQTRLNTEGNYWAGFNGNYAEYAALRFNASDSNPIYGKSNTVQPPAYTVRAWLREA